MSLSLYYHTIKYLQPRQVIWRLIYKWTKVKLHSTLVPPPLRKNKILWVSAIEKPVHFSSSHTAHFLNQAKNISSKESWNDAACDKLWLYHLHYFDDLNTKDAKQRASWHIELINRWMQENPIGKGNGWEPYTLSLRIVNWIKWNLAGNIFTPEMLQSLAIQVRFLAKRIEWHLLGNHLLANAKALVFAGLFFEGKEAKTWFNQGMKIFDQELSEQILPDGAHFELSPMYQGIILEDFLDLIQLFRIYRWSVPAVWVETVKKMLIWLEGMIHPDGKISFFNDTALRIAPHFSELKIYADQQNINVEEKKQFRLMHFQNSGYCRLEMGNAVLLADVGQVSPDYLPGHAHADTLSFEFSLKNQRIFVNSGTSTYLSQPLRNQQRGTLAHNTVTIDHQDSSEVWGNFRIARRARIFDVQIQKNENDLFLMASHDGYHRLTQKVTHTRIFKLQTNQLMIQDLLNGKGQHEIELCFHLHPGLSIEQLDHYNLIITDKEKFLVKFIINVPLQVLDSYFYPEFNKAIPNKKILICLKQSMPLNIMSTISWNS